MNFFCLITSDIKDKTAFESFSSRINSLSWPIYEKTENRNILNNEDKLIFYLAGKNKLGGHLVGSGEIQSVENFYDEDNQLADIRLKLTKINIFKNPIFLKSLTEKLDFIKYKKPSHFGLNLQGGCKIITEKDFNLITNLGTN